MVVDNVVSSDGYIDRQISIGGMGFIFRFLLFWSNGDEMEWNGMGLASLAAGKGYPSFLPSSQS